MSDDTERDETTGDEPTRDEPTRDETERNKSRPHDGPISDEEARRELADSSWILEVRRKLADPPPGVLVPREAGPGGSGEGPGPEAFAPRRAAALVPLFVDAGQLWTVITLRTQRLAGHASPPAFPGALYGPGTAGEAGQVGEGDEEGEDAPEAAGAEAATADAGSAEGLDTAEGSGTDPAAPDPAAAWLAALTGGEREAGLFPQAALDLGRLDEVATPAGVIVTPCVAAIPEPALRKREEPAEDAGVADVVPIPLTVLAHPQLVERRPVQVAGEESELLILHVGRHRIWGVTAEIIVNLLARLGMAQLGEE